MTGTDGSGEFDLKDAYAVETPDDNRKLYREWADTYESGYMADRGYVYHENVSEVFLADQPGQPVLDVGCGTGVVGQVLAAAGLATIDGIDISPEMLEKAGEKTTAAGAPVYRNLIEADLTTTIDLPDNHYGGIISVGTFTIGHLPPDSLSELFRVAAPGATFGIGVNTWHYRSAPFGSWLDAAVDAGTISPYELTEIPMYSAGDDEHANDTAYVIRFTLPSS